MKPHEADGSKLGFTNVGSKGNLVFGLPVAEGAIAENKMMQAVVSI
jgi:hypothetical protein